MARLVTLGDSITQGFQSGAITYSELSYPAIIAECMGLEASAFRQATFSGAGGLPMNLEYLARKVEEHYGPTIDLFEWPGALALVARLMLQTEDYWERGEGAIPPLGTYHNLAVWGFEVADVYNIDAAWCAEQIGTPRRMSFGPPSKPRLRTAQRVLSTGHRESLLDIAERIAREEDGIDHLIVALGSNNCLKTVMMLKVIMTGEDPPGTSSNCTLWSVRAFEQEYELLARRVALLGAKHTYVATVPHVTIPPITRGINRDLLPLAEGERYFDFYARFFLRDDAFDPSVDAHLTKAQARMIDEHIDDYNAIIRRHAREHGWEVVDLCELLDRLAARSSRDASPYPLPPALGGLDIRMLSANASGEITQGGLMSLDGVHPTTCGYGLVAQQFIDKMRAHEPAIKDVDFTSLRARDPLIAKPPRTIGDVIDMLAFFERSFHLSSWLNLEIS